MLEKKPGINVKLHLVFNNNNNNNRRLVTLAEHTSDHGRQTNSSTEEKGEQVYTWFLVYFYYRGGMKN